MNNFDLLGRPLRVQWANSPQLPMTPPAAPPPAPPPAPPAAPGVFGAPGGGGATAGAATTSASSDGSGNNGGGYRCTVLENMVAAVEAADPELEGEIKEECSKYGAVETVKVRARSCECV